MFTTAAKNAMLGALAIDALSLHSGFPGLTGANEISGGAPAYARKPITFGAAAGGTRTTTSSVTFDVPASTVRWIGAWAAGVFMGYAPNGGTPLEFVVDPGTDTFRAPAHGLTDTTTVVLFNGTVPGGLVEGNVYFVRDATADTFRLAAASGGVALDITSAGTSDCLLSIIVQSVYAAQGTHTLSTGTVGLPL
jgi:hypothetical protein